MKNDQIYKCPDDSGLWPGYPIGTFYDGSFLKRQEKRSYGTVGTINTQQNLDAGASTTYDDNTGLSTDCFTYLAKGRSASGIDESAGTLALIEDWINLRWFG